MLMSMLWTDFSSLRCQMKKQKGAVGSKHDDQHRAHKIPACQTENHATGREVVTVNNITLFVQYYCSTCKKKGEVSNLTTVVGVVVVVVALQLSLSFWL